MGVTHPSKNTRKRQCDTYKWYQDTPNSSLLTPISGISLCIDTLFRCLARVSILGSFSETPKIGATLVLAPLLGACELPLPNPSPNPSPTPTKPLPHPYLHCQLSENAVLFLTKNHSHRDNDMNCITQYAIYQSILQSIDCNLWIATPRKHDFFPV